MFNSRTLVLSAFILLVTSLTSPIQSQPTTSYLNCKVCRDRDCSANHIACNQKTRLSKFKCEARKKRWISRCETATRICLKKCS